MSSLNVNNTFAVVFSNKLSVKADGFLLGPNGDRMQFETINKFSAQLQTVHTMLSRHIQN